MKFTMIKRYMPKSLFGRGVLILLVPILSLLVIVSFAFVQRHFDGVTRQLARGVALEVAALVDQVELHDQIMPDDAQLARRLGLTLNLEPGPFDPGEVRAFYDISGRLVLPILQEVTRRPVQVNLTRNWRRANIRVAMSKGTLRITAPRGRMTASNPHQLLVLMFSGAILLTIISLLFLRNQVKPIRRLAQASEAFGKGRAVPFRPAGAEEVRRAGTAFLAMRNRIERQIEQRTMMLSGVSHDLRTPLTRIKLALATAENLEDLEPLNHDLAEMERMLDAFLAFARDASSDETETVSPVIMAEQIVADAMRGGAEVTLDVIGDRDGTVNLRKMQMHRAIANLVSNAQRYGDQVRLTVQMRQRTVTFLVEDNGPGIAEEDRVEALKPFSRLDPARNQDRGSGTGLGLAIAMDTARLHGGTLSLGVSDALGGLLATLKIPR